MGSLYLHQSHYPELLYITGKRDELTLDRLWEQRSNLAPEVRSTTLDC